MYVATMMASISASSRPALVTPVGEVPESSSGWNVDCRKLTMKVGRSRQGCREVFEKRFTSEVMAANYERVYYRLIDERRNATAVTGRLGG